MTSFVSLDRTLPTIIISDINGDILYQGGIYSSVDIDLSDVETLVFSSTGVKLKEETVEEILPMSEYEISYDRPSKMILVKLKESFFEDDWIYEKEFEYEVDEIWSEYKQGVSKKDIQRSLHKYSDRGFRLVSSLSSDIEQGSSKVILVYERKLKKAEEEEDADE